MSLDNNTVQQIARLARLHIDEKDLEKYSTELSNIMDLVAKMQTCDTDGIEPMTHPFDASLRLRDDKITESNQRDKFQQIAPAVEKGLYLVPKVLD